jgi:hypothetical protein
MSGSNTDSEQRTRLLAEIRAALVTAADAHDDDPEETADEWVESLLDAQSLAVLAIVLPLRSALTKNIETFGKVKQELEAEIARLKVAGQSTASQPTLADDVLAKVLAYCKDPEAFEGGGYFFVYLDRDKVVRIIRGQEAVDAKPSEPNRG